MSAAGGHSQPFYCAYCGEETIEPVGEAGGWWCSSCLRAFTLRLAGTGAAARDVLAAGGQRLAAQP